MGERLVINFYDKGKRLCNSYFHWDGFTPAITEDVTKAIAFFNISKCERRDISTRFHALAAFKALGCCQNEEAVHIMAAEDKETLEYPWKGANRNDGLVGVTEEEMADNSKWAEHEVDIHVDKEEIVLDNFLWHVSAEDKEYMTKEELEELNTAVEIDTLIEDINKVSYGEFYKLSQFVEWASVVRFGGEAYEVIK